MKNKGFIATSLLYSFFLVFVSLLLMLVGTYLHNRLLLNNVVSGIKNDLSEVGIKTLASSEIGSYITMPIFGSGVEIASDNLKWIVVSKNADKSVTLVSDNVIVSTNNYKSLTLLQEELDRFRNLYSTGTSSINYITYLTNSHITNFTNNTNLSIRKALLSEGSEYFYYNTSNSRFYLYQYTCNLNNVCSAAKNSLIATNSIVQYGLRLIVNISSSAPIKSGIGTLNEPFDLLYYVHNIGGNNVLKLHYDNINNSGNKGYKTSANTIEDLSGNNPTGVVNAGNYTNVSTTGISLPASRYIDAKHNIRDVIASSKGYTIEFRTRNNLRLASNPSYLNNFILLTGSTSIKLYNSTFVTGAINNTDNTFTIVKRPGVTNLIVYLNGEKIAASINVANLMSAVNNVLYVGGSTNVENFKSIRIYNTGLSDLDIKHNYSLDTRWRLP